MSPHQSLTRLNQLHSHFTQLRGADYPLLKASDFDAKLDEMAAVITSLKGLGSIERRLSNLNGAMDLLLDLLSAAHAHKLDGGHLHCLLEPLRERLNKAIDDMDGIL